ncbi:GIY-YIG nuclease family protein [Kaistia dalseonensis]|uniref:GIY-YIG domain-containing protein n=1 Tax=Kaistia dalseonensis TaxID=410840 RepID=A0ABU0H2G1_9HYPH|nr:GIY-YIG nuclease family protein [Kaistia dalseonensis]MCX5493917.1 GIY-YIG nuclease family protein [Kaistia dalseonensis]MDQ0436486.1 hypothetical protein [Kaistia dalseonensis]
MITHYGLFWSSADVLWAGKKGDAGHLRGRERVQLERRGRPTKEEYDNSSEYSNWIGVYCLYRDSRLVYVGEAGLGNEANLFQRLKQHRTDHLAEWWDEFSWFGCPPTSKTSKITVGDAFAQLEAVLIAVTNPGFNKQSGTFRDAIQVFQVPHKNAEGDIVTKLGRLMAKLEEIETKVTPRPEPKKRGRKPKAAIDE